jgi:hypothetical protein
MKDISFEDLPPAEQDVALEVGEMFASVVPDAAAVFDRMQEVGLLVAGEVFVLTTEARALHKAGNMAELLHRIHDGWAEWETQATRLPLGQAFHEWTTKRREHLERFYRLSLEKQIELLEQARWKHMGTKTVFARDADGEFVETAIKDLSASEFERISETLVRDGLVEVPL